MKTATGTQQTTPTDDTPPARRESAAPTPLESLVRLVTPPPARSSVPPPLPAPARTSTMPPAASSRPPRGSLPPVLPPPRKLAARDDGEPTVHDDARVAALAVRETLVQLQQSLEALHRRVDGIERRHERAALAPAPAATIAVAESAPLGLDAAIDGARRRRRTIAVMLFAVLAAAGALVSLAANHP